MSRPRPGHLRRLACAAALAALAPGLLACSSSIRNHGHRLDDLALVRVEPGRTTRDEVVQLLGSPSTLATFDDSAWYYVSQRTEEKSFYQHDVVAQEVVTITFDRQGTVTGIERHGLEQARAIDPVSRETPTAGNELSILEQFIGNIGRFNLPRDDRDQPPDR